MAHKCCFCGKEVTFLFSYQLKVKGQKYYICPDCRTKYRHREANFFPDGTAKVIEIEDSEIRKKCNVCGHLYCYSLYDLERNKEKARSAMLSSVASIAGTVGGAYTASAVNNGNAENALNGIVDYNRCPHCGSMDVRTLSKEEWATEQAKTAQGSTTAPAVSAADELKKFRELLDSGVITQEEFDAKKKQLLGL